MKYLVFGISIAFISWMVGMILNELIKKESYYINLSNLKLYKE